MAGLGRRTFAPGEVLTATNVMGYLQDQAVMKFAGTAARGSAIGTAVSEGMVSYLADSDAVEVYDGSAWLGLGPTGRILQTVTSAYYVQTSNSTTTYVATGLTATITPKKASSKILVLAMTNGIYKDSATAGNGASVELRRNSTAIQEIMNFGYTGTSSLIIGFSASQVYLDSPNTTSATTYATYIKTVSAGGGVGCQQAGGRSEIILMEISA